MSDRTDGLVVTTMGCKEMLERFGPTMMEDAEKAMRDVYRMAEEQIIEDVYDPLLCIMEDHGLIPPGWEVEFVPLHPLVDEVEVALLEEECKEHFQKAIFQIDMWIRAKGGEKWLPLGRIEDPHVLRQFYTEQEIIRRRLQYELCPECGVRVKRRIDGRNMNDIITCPRCGWKGGYEEFSEHPRG